MEAVIFGYLLLGNDLQEMRLETGTRETLDGAKRIISIITLFPFPWFYSADAAAFCTYLFVFFSFSVFFLWGVHDMANCN